MMFKLSGSFCGETEKVCEVVVFTGTERSRDILLESLHTNGGPLFIAIAR